MAQNLFKSVTVSLLLMSFLAACGNVRFSASSSTDGTGTTSGTNGTPGDDGAIAGNDGGPRPGDDGSVPGATPTPTPPPSGARDVSYSLQVPAASNKVDFLLVIDNSASMIAVQQKMAQSMSALASQMNSLNIDWQMCLTVTTDMNKGGTASGTGTHTCTGGYCTGTYTGGNWYWGVSLPWVNGKYAINKTDLSADANIFNNTIPKIGSGDSGTGDERGIKAAYNHFANWKASGQHNTSSCYRAGSSVAVILLSDEDERSVAGDCSRVNTALGDKEIPSCREYGTGALRVLEFQDQPSNLVSQANAVFGDTSRFTFNSIISDTDACTTQLNNNASFVKDGVPYYSPHYTGTVYKQASALTGGGVASLCSSDLKLNLFSDVVVNTLSKLTMECAPTSLTVKKASTQAGLASAAALPASAYSVSGAVITFNPALQQNDWVSLQYHCAQ
ncbi:MAG: hypothetical protein JSU04_07025 [Bdellovibrionales bacterium]|nr:hypothetical protein [Bdellovibrionales bacterium]